MQKFSDFSEIEHLNVGIPKMYDDIVTALSNSSGEAFPTANLQVGMVCYRTDLKQGYRLSSLTNGIPTWTLCEDSNIPLNNAYFDGDGNEIAKTYLKLKDRLFTVDSDGDIVLR
jgi:hypothetical protein|nr:MAG TPA: hypothetical protein [Bacteriophage sp.]